MIEDIKLYTFPKKSGVYLFKENDEVIYVGSSKNLNMRMMSHRSCIRQGSAHGYKQDFYQFLKANQFTVEFQLTDNYKQLEQHLIEQHHPKYNANRANGRDVERYKEYQKEYQKEYYQQNCKKRIEHQIEYYQQNCKKRIEYQNKYNNQPCCYNGETLTLNALRIRFSKAGIAHPAKEAKKYLLK